MPILLTATLVASLIVAPLAAAAPVLDPLKPCYVTVQTGQDSFETESVRVGGNGFTPGSLVDVTVDDEVQVSGIQIGPDGRLPTGSLTSPPILAGQRPIAITAAERDGGPSVTEPAMVSALAVRVTPRRALPSEQVRFRGRGFTNDAGVYAHYIRRGKLRKTVRLADQSAGACGTFDTWAPQFPFEPRKGIWRLQVDQQRRLTDEGPLFNLTIDVRRRPTTR